MKRKAIFKLMFFTIILASISLLILPKNIVKIQSATANKMLAVNTSSWDTNKVTVYTDPNGVVVPIPKGYVVSGVSTEKTVKTGLVIYEGTASVTSAPTSGSSVLSSAQATRNQWVWVPVNDLSRIYSENSSGVKTTKIYSFSSTGRTILNDSNTREPGVLDYADWELAFSRYGLQGETRETFTQKLQIEYEETMKSIQKYGGFYIGRYETGDLSKKCPVVKKINTDLGAQTWYEDINRVRNLGANSNVKTNLIWGCLYDEVLQWLVESGSKTYSQVGVDATSWGNYYNATFTYVTTSGGSATKSKTDRIKIPTGSAEYAKANNIYDLAGNIRDWTLEGYNGSSRKNRGGDFAYSPGNTYPPGSRAYHNDPNNMFEDIGYRAYLYIK